MDRRKDKRFRVNAGGFARLRSKPAKLGKIIDISRTGLALNYIDRYRQLGDSSELERLITTIRIPSLFLTTSSTRKPISRNTRHFSKLSAGNVITMKIISHSKTSRPEMM